MLRTRLAKSYIKRTIRPIYGWTQTTPKSVFLDPAWDRSVAVYPGMAFCKTVGENVTLVGTNRQFYGLGALYIGGDGIDEILDSGINAFAVWVMGPDAEFELLAPAFDNGQTWTDAGSAAPALVYASTSGANQGQLVPAAYQAGNASTCTLNAVGRLLKVNSPTKITIGGLAGTAA